MGLVDTSNHNNNDNLREGFGFSTLRANGTPLLRDGEMAEVKQTRDFQGLRR